MYVPTRSMIDFYEAPPLTSFYEHGLFENYDYEYSLLSKIASNFKISGVFRVYNPELYGLYLLYKAELKCDGSNVKEVMLYHATSQENARSIAHSNIDWRMTRRSRFGVRSYFSTSPVYADRYANSRGAFVLCKVLIKKIQRLFSVRYGLQIPKNTSYDTILNYDKKVYVKFDDYNFYPEFIVYYSRK